MGELWGIVREGGAEGVLAVLVWLVLTGKLRLEREYLDMRDQRDRARAGEREATQTAVVAADIAERVVRPESEEANA